MHISSRRPMMTAWRAHAIAACATARRPSKAPFSLRALTIRRAAGERPLERAKSATTLGQHGSQSVNYAARGEARRDDSRGPSPQAAASRITAMTPPFGLIETRMKADIDVADLRQFSGDRWRASPKMQPGDDIAAGAYWLLQSRRQPAICACSFTYRHHEISNYIGRKPRGAIDTRR